MITSHEAVAVMLGVPLPLAVFEGVSGPTGDAHVARSQGASLADRDPRPCNCRNRVSSEADLSPDGRGPTSAAATSCPPDTSRQVCGFLWLR